MDKVSIVVDKTLSAGQKANVAAIIMGQIALYKPKVYAETVIDKDGTVHTGISVNIVILDGTVNQLMTLIANARDSGVDCFSFTKTGQELSNSYPEYREKISRMNTAYTGVIGVGVHGDAEVIKSLTKKFSLTR